MLHYDAIRALTDEHRLHHEAEAGVERIALQARGVRRVRRLPQLRIARREAMQRAGYVVVTMWPRR
jgi:hypothetical protein